MSISLQSTYVKSVRLRIEGRRCLIQPAVDYARKRIVQQRGVHSTAKQTVVGGKEVRDDKYSPKYPCRLIKCGRVRILVFG